MGAPSSSMRWMDGWSIDDYMAWIEWNAKKDRISLGFESFMGNLHGNILKIVEWFNFEWDGGYNRQTYRKCFENVENVKRKKKCLYVQNTYFIFYFGEVD